MSITSKIKNTIIDDALKIKDKNDDEWIWVEGYKGTDKNMCCRGYHFECDEQFDIPENEEVEMCKNGFHLCLKLSDVLDYYDIGNGNRFFKVKALVRKKDYDNYGKSVSFNPAPYGFYSVPTLPSNSLNKLVSKSIMFTEEIDANEIFDAITGLADRERVAGFTYEQKVKALKTNINSVFDEIRVGTLMELGYSEEIAEYIINVLHRYDLACVLSKQPDISMDTRISIIFNTNTSNNTSIKTFMNSTYGIGR